MTTQTSIRDFFPSSNSCSQPYLSAPNPTIIDPPSPTPAQSAPQPSPQIFSTPFCICSFNARGSTSTQTHPFKPTELIKLTEFNDITCFQEVSSLPTFRKKYCICDHNDLAIISTEPISFIYSDSSFIVGETTIQDVPVRVFSVHLPCNINRQKLTDTCHLIVKLASTQVSILAGDFNLDPQRPKDQHFFSIMRGILANANLTWHKNYLNTRFPDHIQHSAHSLDHFFLSIPKSHTSLKIVPSSHSDHATLTLTIAQIAPIKTSCIKHIKSPIEYFDSLLTQRTKDVRDYY